MVEVSIASTVFSIVLLVALTSFFTIGRLFYKGVSITQTQDAITQLYQDINGNFQSAASISPPQTGNGYSYYCVGNARYTYKIHNMVSLDVAPDHAPNGNFGILKDILPGNSSACAVPCNDQGSTVCSPGTAKFDKPIELLGQKMRIEKFNIQSNGASLYDISLVVAYGDDDVLEYAIPGPPPDYSSVACKNDSSSQQFCSVSRLNTAIYRGLGY
jgi:hypothetical protein